MLKNLLLSASCALLLSSCWISDPEEPVSEPMYEPVYMLRDSLDASVQILPARAIENSGKIYIINNLLCVGEARKGFHVFDNADPSNPEKIHFLQVLGATDIAVRNNLFYLNQATDLIALRYNFEENSVSITERIANVFPPVASPSGRRANTQDGEVVVNWLPKN